MDFVIALTTAALKWPKLWTAVVAELTRPPRRNAIYLSLLECPPFAQLPGERRR